MKVELRYSGIPAGSRISYDGYIGTLVKLAGTPYDFYGSDYTHHYVMKLDEEHMGGVAPIYGDNCWILAANFEIEILSKYPIIPTTFLEGVEL